VEFPLIAPPEIVKDPEQVEIPVEFPLIAPPEIVKDPEQL